MERRARPRVIDISRANHPTMHRYPGDPPLRVERTSRLADGQACNLALLVMGNHTGTHVDAPLHVLPGGRPLGDVGLDGMVGEALVVDLRGRTAIDATALAGVTPDAGDIVLCRTDNSWRWDARDLDPGFPHLTEDAATHLVALGVRGVGIDTLSVDAFDAPGLPVHRRLLAAGVTVIEGLALHAAEPGRYMLVCLPLKFPELDGAPARAILLAWESRTAF